MNNNNADVIRQDELETLVQISRAESVLFASLARRVHAGATIEPGTWVFKPGQLEELPDNPVENAERGVRMDGYGSVTLA